MKRLTISIAMTLIFVTSATSSVAHSAQMPQIPQMPSMSVPSAGLPFKDVLGRASDQALNKLSQPGAFAADDAVKITLPGPAKGISGMMAMAGKAGVGGDLTGSLNAAAGDAAGAAKPIFRAAIDNMTLQDAGGLVGQTGATDYLRKSAGGAIKSRLIPLVRSALEKSGVLAQVSKLSAVGMSADTLTDYVAQKTSDGIFTYMGREETRLRQNPTALFQR